MANIIDLKGLIFGRLTVLNINPKRGNRRQIKWDCICECGNKHTVTGESLRSKKSKSCGCLLKECRYVINKNTDREKAMLKLVYSSLKKRHTKKTNNKEYISFDFFRELSFGNCFYCNSEPSNTQPDIRYETRYGKKEKIIISDFVLRYNGIDRINSFKGYEKDNVVSCCRTCNVAKMQMSTEEFKEQIIKIYDFFASK